MSLFGHSLGSVMCYDLMYNTCQAQGLLQATYQPAPSAPPPPSAAAAAAAGEDKTDCPSPFSSLNERFAELQQLRLRVAAIEGELGAASNHKILHFKVSRTLPPMYYLHPLFLVFPPSSSFLPHL